MANTVRSESSKGTGAKPYSALTSSGTGVLTRKPHCLFQQTKPRIHTIHDGAVLYLKAVFRRIGGGVQVHAGYFKAAKQQKLAEQLFSDRSTFDQRMPLFAGHFKGKRSDRAGLKEIPHKRAAYLAVPFPPCTSCKFLDLPPASLRNLQARLTENSLASQPPFLCGISLRCLLEAMLWWDSYSYFPHSMMAISPLPLSGILDGCSVSVTIW